MECRDEKTLSKLGIDHFHDTNNEEVSLNIVFDCTYITLDYMKLPSFVLSKWSHINNSV